MSDLLTVPNGYVVVTGYTGDFSDMKTVRCYHHGKQVSDGTVLSKKALVDEFVAAAAEKGVTGLHTFEFYAPYVKGPAVPEAGT